MNSRLSSKYQDEIDTQASDWFALVALGSPTTDQQRALQQWQEKDPAHQAAYSDIETIWQNMADLPAEAFSAERGALENVLPFDSNKDKTPTCEKSPPKSTVAVSTKPFLKFAPFAAAAVVIFSVCISFSVLLFKPSEAQQYITGIGELENITLDDGTHIYLSAQSEIDVHLSSKQRRITFKRGEAYFDVATQLRDDGSKIPFLIHVDDIVVEVVGTAFEVKKQDDKTSVTVVEGIVEVHSSNADAHASLTSGQRVAVVGPSRKLKVMKDIGIESIASWRSGRLTYLDATLGDVISDAQRFHPGNISLTDKSLSSLRVTTSFGIDEIPDLAKILESILPVRAYFGDHGLIVISKDNRKG